MKIGIDLGGSHVGVGLIENDKILINKQINFTDNDRKDIKNKIVEYGVKLITEIKNERNEAIEKIGIAAPGLISENIIVKTPNLDIDKYDFAQKFREIFNCEVTIKNDAKCSALAEKEFGSLKKYNDAIYICIGTGIGGAVFLGGKLLKPEKFSGFEFGHMVIVKNGRLCSCGKRGCFEAYASISALKARVTSILHERPDVTGQYLREELLIKDNDLVKDEVEDFLESLKVGIGNLIDMFEPQAICLGGSFAYYEGNPILDRLILKLQEYDTTFTISKRPEIVLPKYHNDSGMIGAVL